MRWIFGCCILLFGMISCRSQGQGEPPLAVGGPCEGCEALLEYGDMRLTSTDTLPLFEETEPKLRLTGTVYQADGRTPAAGIILYVYHTDREGIYPTRGNETGWARRHGYIRGWVQTGEDGQYTFYTFRPAAYPQRSEPEHLHLTVLEPGFVPYYLDSFQFSDDPLLTGEERQGMPDRGGSGIVTPRLEGGIRTVRRDIFLGRNIPDYPR